MTDQFIYQFPPSFKNVRGATPEDIGMTLAHLAARVPRDQAIVELGVFCGRTALQLAYGAFLGQGAHVWGVDAWDLPGTGYGPPFNDPATRHLAYRNIRDQRQDHRITLLHGYSHEVAQSWTGPAVGLLFVDADHTEGGARRDILTWSPHLAPGAVIAVDDYNHPDWPGVAEAIDALVADGHLRPVDVRHERLAVTGLEQPTPGDPL